MCTGYGWIFGTEVKCKTWFIFFLLLYFFSSSCWLSLEGGLLYAFVGPAAVIVLVSLSNVLFLKEIPSLSDEAAPSFHRSRCVILQICLQRQPPSTGLYSNSMWTSEDFPFPSLHRTHASTHTLPGCTQQNDELSTLILEFKIVAQKKTIQNKKKITT